jgi:hypothetical protein
MLGISFKFAETLHSKLKAVDFGQTFESRLQAGHWPELDFLLRSVLVKKM